LNEDDRDRRETPEGASVGPSGPPGGETPGPPGPPAGEPAAPSGPPAGETPAPQGSPGEAPGPQGSSGETPGPQSPPGESRAPVESGSGPAVEGVVRDAVRPRADGSSGEPGGSLKGEETVGEILHAARERLGRTLESMSQETKIPKQMLQYLETDNYEALPAKVYSKSFLRTYGTALDLDIHYILNKYDIQTGQTHKSRGDHWEIETEVVEEKLRSPNIVKRLLIPAAVVVVIAVLIVKFAGKGEDKGAPPKQVALQEELLAKKPVPAQEPAKSDVEPAASPASVEPMELMIVANPTDSCWFELMTVSVVEQQPETTISRFTLPPGRSRTFQATDEFFFKKVGNAGGFVMELNGSKLPTLGKKGRVITNYRITRDNLPKGKKD
jgi:cytoskeletal protein RodZ